MHVVLARYYYRKSSVRPSVRLSVCLSVYDVEVPWVYMLSYFESDYTNNYLSVFAHLSHNIGNLVQRKHP